MEEAGELKVSLSSDGQELTIRFPSGHEVRASAAQAGVLMFRVLKEQEGLRAAGKAAGFGSLAQPTQRMVEEFLAKGGKVTRIAKLKPPPAALSFEDLFNSQEKA